MSEISVEKKKELVKEFYELRNYPDRLNFWKNHFSYLKDFILFPELVRTISESVNLEKAGLDRPDAISIRPKNEEEYAIYKEWFIKAFLIENPSLDIDCKIDKFDKNFTKAIKPLKSIEYELNRVKMELSQLTKVDAGLVNENTAYHNGNILLDYEINGGEPEFPYYSTGSLISFIKIRSLIDYELYLEDRRQETLNPNLEKSIKPLLKWLGTPAQFGFIFLELVKRGYIELPATHGSGSYRRFARNCFQMFEINSTVDNMINELNPGKSSFTQGDRFTIPEQKETTSK